MPAVRLKSSFHALHLSDTSSLKATGASYSQSALTSMPAIEMERQVYQTTGLDGENFGARLQDAGTKQTPADLPAAGGRVARTPDRIPMIQLSPNATQLSTKSGPSNLAVSSRAPEVFREACSAYNLAGSTTHRGNHPAASSRWHLGSGSGSMTARGENCYLFLWHSQVCLMSQSTCMRS